MLRKFGLILLLVLIVAASGCRISGTITHNETGMKDVIVTLNGEELFLTTTTDDSGNYEFENVYIINGVFTIAPKKFGYLFDPQNRDVEVGYSDVTGADFKGTLEKQFDLGVPFWLFYQQTKYNTGDTISITFEEVISDSRCPLDVLCIWAGNAEVAFTFTKENRTRRFTLNTGLEPSEIQLFGYKIKLLDLKPDVYQGVEIPAEEYIAYLEITKVLESCLDNTDCDAISYCEKILGDCDGRGECSLRPEQCPMEWAPVCGCDNRTYGNTCSAAMAGMNVLHLGECCEPVACDLYCKYGFKKDENGCDICECREIEAVELDKASILEP